MTDTSYTPGLAESTPGSDQKASPGVTAIALLLALVLGLSAADINRTPGNGVTADQSAAQLDGRGKWGGMF